VEARGQAHPDAAAPIGERQPPRWVLAVLPLAAIVAALAGLALFGGQTLPERAGPPVEELAVERTVLRPGEIELSTRNTGPDPVTVAQVFVNDAYVDFATSQRTLGRLATATLTLDYPWQEGSPALVTLVTSSGVTIEHEIEATVATPEADAGFYATMGLLGTYVGVVPVLLGMLFLPALRDVRERWLRLFMAFTVGLLVFLAVDGSLEGLELGRAASGAFGGAELLVLGAILAYLSLAALDRHLAGRREQAARAGAGAWRLALMIAVGIGLHNLGEGLAIGSAYAVGELALGAFLVVGFAAHNTTEGFAIVAPFAREERPGLARLGMLGLIAGAPAILGAFVGASINNSELSTFLLGLGVGAIVGVILQLAPVLRDRAGRVLHPDSVAGLIAGMAALYLTGLLVNV
jgi:ZIP family zinc transporter